VAVAFVAAVVATSVGSLGVIWVAVVAAISVIAIAVTWRLERRLTLRRREQEAAAIHERNLKRLEREIRTQRAIERYVGQVQSAVIEDFKRERGRPGG
jgi:hypothetical protein